MPIAPFVVPTAWIKKPSPHHAQRVQPVTAIVLHADASAKIESTLAWLADPVSKVSYHIVISRNGAVFSVVHPDAKAYHAGVSELEGVPFCNSYSIGVSLSNKNDGIEPYPPAQVMSAIEVCARLCSHYGIPVTRIVTHAFIAPTRKTDPKGLNVTAFRASVAAALLPRVA